MNVTDEGRYLDPADIATVIPLILIAFFLILSVWAPFIANGGIAETKSFFSREDDFSQAEPNEDLKTTTEWEQWTKTDFEKGDTHNLDLESTPGEVRLETDTFQIGAAESPEKDSRGGYYYWGSGGTYLGCRDDFRADRGGRIRTFRAAAGDPASAFKLKVLRPENPESVSPGQDAEFSAAQTDYFDPNTEAVTTWDNLDIPIEKDDRMGIYPLGDLAAVALTGQNGYWKYDGEITSTSQFMTHDSEDSPITTIEAIVETNRDSGILNSSVHDCGEHMYNWSTISWDANVPSGSSLTIETRSSPDGSSWSTWEEATNGDVVPSPVNRYIQYKASFTSQTGKETPVLNSIKVKYEVDKDPPQINHQSIDEWQKDGPYTISAEVKDGGSGLAENPTVYYSTDQGYTWDTRPLNHTQADMYEGYIPDFSHDTDVMYYIEAENTAGITETSPDEGHYHQFSVDKDPPTTEPVLSGEEGENGWFQGQVEIELQASDTHSGVDTTSYQLDGGDWNTYSGPFTLEEAGEHELRYSSTDNVGNSELAGSIQINIDDASPDLTLDRPDPSGDNGWYLDGIQVEITAEDQVSGVDSVEYRINETSWETYSSPVGLDESGVYSLEYRSFDTAGNENTSSVEIKIDREDPTVSTTVSGTEGENGWYLSETEVELIGTDNVSGISHNEYRENESSGWKEYDGPIVLEDGRNSIEYKSVNEAGRESEIEEKEVKVDTGLPTIEYDVEPPEGEGWSTTPPTVDMSTVDEVSGLSRIRYRIKQDGDWVREETLDDLDNISDRDVNFDLDLSGNLQVELFAEDVAGNNFTTNFEYPVDLEKPTIPDAPSVSDTVWRNDMTIATQIDEDHSGVDKVTLHYSTGDSWKKKEMARDGGEYKATIPGEDVGFGDVEYYISVQDTAGNSFESERRTGEVGINWIYLIPIPVAIVLIGLLVYWRRKREEQEQLIPMKESKISKIKKGKEDKLEEIKDEGDKSTAAPVGLSSEDSGERCDKCGSAIDSQNLLTCSCGDHYHDDCLRMEGNCMSCGKDYATVSLFSEEAEEETSSEGTEDETGLSETGIEEPQDVEESTETKKGPEGVEVWADERGAESTKEVQKKVKKARKVDETEEQSEEQSEEDVSLEEEVEEMMEDEEPKEETPPEDSLTEEETPPPSPEETSTEEEMDEEPPAEEPSPEETSAEEETPPPPSSEESTESEEETPDEEKEDVEGDAIECPLCGNENEAGSEKCWACRADLTEDEEG